MAKTLKTRVINKHDIEANWLLATNFIPMNGEIIIYDEDNNYDYKRVKIGDGKTLVSNLPFIDKKLTDNIAEVEDLANGAVTVAGESLSQAKEYTNQQLENYTTKDYVTNLYTKLNTNTVLGFYCIEDVTIVINGISKVYPANSNVEIKFIEDDEFEIIPTSNSSILALNAFPGALGTYYPWLEGVKQFSNILFDMNDVEMYSKWSQGNQGSYQVQFAQYTNCIFWSDNPFVSDVKKRTNYTLYYTSQVPLCYSNIPDNTFKAFYLAASVVSDPNWGNPLYKESFAKATWATQAFSYYGARTIGLFGHDAPGLNITLPKDCRGLMYGAMAIENAGTFDASNTTKFGAKAGSWQEAFGECISLRNLYIKNLKTNLNLSWSPIGYESIYFIISEATNENAITISLSPYTYNLLRDSDFELAASKNITIELIASNYTEDKRWSEIANKADKEHTHTIEDIDGLESIKTQSDWNVNDENDPAFIQNRPFYSTDPVETEIVNGTFEFEDMGNGSIYMTVMAQGAESQLVEGQNIKINWDNVEYNTIVQNLEMMPGALFAGNGSLMNSMGGLSLEDTGEPFVLLYDPSQIALGAFTSSTENTHNITLITEDISYIKIDEKYLPDSVFEKVGLSTTGKTYDIDGNVVTAKEGAEIFNDYINNKASGKYSHAEGRYTTASGNNSHAEGEGTTASKRNSHAEGESTTASGRNSHSEGYETTASQENSHAEGSKTTALGRSSHIEGESFNKLPDTITASSTNDEIINIWNTTKFSLAKGDISHVEGRDNLALGYCSHAEGFGTIALDGYSHAEGSETTASGQQSHAEGEYTTASGRNSHAEGNNTTASGDGSHTEGCSTIAAGEYSHAEGWFTIASGHRSHVQGKYNVQETDLNAYGYGKYAHIVGNGTSDTKRSNAHTLDWDGNAWFAGDVLVGGTSQDDTTAVKLATEIYVDTKVADLVNSAPETLDTLGELATALQENADVVETLNEAITNKADKSDVAQSDWNVNDEADPAFIKNRPFYTTDPVETTIFEEQELDFNENVIMDNVLQTMLVEGQTYTVICNGTSYECIARNGGYDNIYIGNQSVCQWGDGFAEIIDSDEPFFIATYEQDNWSEITVAEPGIYTISISAIEITNYKIDKKYLPDIDIIGKSTAGTEYLIYDEENDEEYTVVALDGAEIFNSMNNKAIGAFSHAEGQMTTAVGDCSHVEGIGTTAHGINSHAEGQVTSASGACSHAEGDNTISSGKCSHAEGFEAQAIGEASHAEGGYKFENDKLMDAMIVDSYYYSKLTEEIVVKAPMAYGKQSHAEGSRTLAYGLSSHAEGDRSMAFGTASHAEGDLACASGNYSHAEGYDTMASGDYSHTEGEGTIASGTSAHAEGGWTRALGDYQHAQGKNNIEDAENRYAHIVGNGESTLHRSNAHTLDWDGNAEFQGDVKANACGGENPISLIALYNTIQTLTERIAVLEAALNTDSLTETDANALVEEVFN